MNRHALEEEFRAKMAIYAARRTIDLARVRVIPFDRLIERLLELHTGNLSSEVVYAIEERDLTIEQYRSLSIALRELISTVNSTPRINRERMDRRIGRLLQILPPELSKSIALDCISHKRKSHRTAGLKGLKLKSIDQETSRIFIKCFDSTNDVRILKSLLKFPLVLTSTSPKRLLSIFEHDEYWRMRVIEATLRADRQFGLDLSETYPASFIWAAGRIGDPALLPKIHEYFRRANDKLDLLSIVSWAYGKLAAHEELQSLHLILEQLEEEYEIVSD